MSDERKGFFQSRSGLVFLGFALVAGYFLWTEHRAHVATVVPYLPFLLFLLCPLMHLFHGHGDHGSHEGHDHGTKSKGGDGR